MTGQGKCAIDTLLAESFKELAKKHPIEKITIKEITDLAGVIRPTFYNHFQDKYELLEWIITTDLLDPIEPLIQNGMINEGLVLLFTNIEKDSEFYSRAIKLEGQNSFGEIAQSCVEKILFEGDRRCPCREETEVFVADAKADRRVLCTVHVLCCNYMDPIGNDDFSKGACRDL